MENQILHNNQNSQHAISNNCCSKRDDSPSTLEVQSFDNPSEDSCVIIDVNVNNDMIQNKGSMQRDGLPATVEGQSKNPFGDPYLIVSSNANLRATKNIVNHKRDESTITSAHQPFVVNTEVSEDMNAEFSRLKNNNDSLQENVEVLRDENELLRDTMEVLTRKLEEYRANVCDLSEINCRNKSDLPSFPARIKDEEWINHLNLVHQIT